MHHSPFRWRWTGGTAAVNGMEERDRVDASTNLCSQLWLLLAGDPSVLARLILLFHFIFLFNLWLSLVGGISAIARLNLFIFAELLRDYCCLLLELLGGLCLLMALCWSDVLYLLCRTNPLSFGLVVEWDWNKWNPLQTSIGSVHSATNLNIERTTTVAQMGKP